MPNLDLRYAAMLKRVGPYLAKGRTVSQAFLAWFLENIYRLEETEAQDAICDGNYDQGIDAIYVDDSLGRIDVFQAKTAQNSKKGVGDTEIKEFKGSLDQLHSKSSVEALHAKTKNPELARLLEKLDIAQLLEENYEVRGVFVTNAITDPSADSYIAQSKANIVIWDRTDIAAGYVSDEHTPPPQKAYTFDTFGWDIAQFGSSNGKTVIAPLAAIELIQMDGIASGQLFDYNVRRSLGNTKVNKDIRNSVRQKSEHRNFLMYHNGITMVADTVDASKAGKVTIKNPVVVNGCQSLTALWASRGFLTDDLRILTRLIEIDRSSPIMGLITRNSNNQNGIKARDFQSNSAIQLRLRNEFNSEFKGKVFYQINRGEEPPSPDSEVIDNETAARLLLSFDLKMPYSSHQTYRLFDDLHAEIFARPEVTAARIVALHDIYSVVKEKLDSLQHERFAKYALTRFFLVYVVARVLEMDDVGKHFVEAPDEYVGSAGDRKRLRAAIGEVLDDLIVDLNAEVESREAEEQVFEFKQDLKSPTAVRELATDTLTGYEKAVKRKRAPSFADLWKGESS